MNGRITSAGQFEAIARLHTREHTGQVGRRSHLLATGAGLGLIALAGYRLFSLTSSWQELSSAEVQPRLWLMMLSSWLSIGVMAALYTLQTALHRQDIASLLPLPIDHAARWRLVLVRVGSHFGPMMVAGMLITAFALSRFGLAWAITFLLWLPAALCLGVLLTLYVAWLSGHGNPRRLAIIGTLAVPAIAVAVFMLTSRSAGHSLPPLAMIPDAILIPALVIGPGARRLGRWYLSLAQERYHAPASARDFLGPVSHWLGAFLSRYRSPWAAIALKELRVQSRDVFLLLRMAVVLAAIPLYALTHDVFADRGIDGASLIAAYALVLGIYCGIETTPSPFGGEGNRLTLALLCPGSSRSLIAGKVFAVTAPLLAQTWIVLLLLGVWNNADPMKTLLIGLTATIGVGSIGMVITCLSVRDIDLETSVDGTSQALIVEHVPNRPMRLVIIGIALVLASGAALAICVLPWFVSLAVVTVMGTLLAGLAFRDGVRQLDRLSI